MKEKIEKVINHFLSLDPESNNRLKKLEGKVLQIEVEGFKKIFQLRFINNKIHIYTHDFLSADVTIKGTPLLFLHLSLTNNRKKLLQDLEITGDTSLAQITMDLFDSMDIDWEEYLSHWIGDAPAFQIGQFTRKIKKTKKKLHESFIQQTSDYLHEEINLFPPKAALIDFFADIDELRLETDRLAARIDSLINIFSKENSL